tara:strand:- start:182 stop:517 length:336 start_codon:yes stop_codon:yes gene_type:complete
MKIMKTLWKNTSKRSSKLTPRATYAVTSGERQGGFLVWIKEYSKNNNSFLFMPNPMEAIQLSKVETNELLKDGTMELIETLPKEVYDVCAANWKLLADKSGLIYEKEHTNN